MDTVIQIPTQTPKKFWTDSELQRMTRVFDLLIKIDRRKSRALAVNNMVKTLKIKT